MRRLSGTCNNRRHILVVTGSRGASLCLQCVILRLLDCNTLKHERLKCMQLLEEAKPELIEKEKQLLISVMIETIISMPELPMEQEFIDYVIMEVALHADESCFLVLLSHIQRTIVGRKATFLLRLICKLANDSPILSELLSRQHSFIEGAMESIYAGSDQAAKEMMFTLIDLYLEGLLVNRGNAKDPSVPHICEVALSRCLQALYVSTVEQSPYVDLVVVVFNSLTRIVVCMTEGLSDRNRAKLEQTLVENLHNMVICTFLVEDGAGDGDGGSPRTVNEKATGVLLVAGLGCIETILDVDSMKPSADILVRDTDIVSLLLETYNTTITTHPQSNGLQRVNSEYANDKEKDPASLCIRLLSSFARLAPAALFHFSLFSSSLFSQLLEDFLDTTISTSSCGPPPLAWSMSLSSRKKYLAAILLQSVGYTERFTLKLRDTMLGFLLSVDSLILSTHCEYFILALTLLASALDKCCSGSTDTSTDRVRSRTSASSRAAKASKEDWMSIDVACRCLRMVVEVLQWDPLTESKSSSSLQKRNALSGPLVLAVLNVIHATPLWLLDDPYDDAIMCLDLSCSHHKESLLSDFGIVLCVCISNNLLEGRPDLLLVAVETLIGTEMDLESSVFTELCAPVFETQSLHRYIVRCLCLSESIPMAKLLGRYIRCVFMRNCLLVDEDSEIEAGVADLCKWIWQDSSVRGDSRLTSSIMMRWISSAMTQCRGTSSGTSDDFLRDTLSAILFIVVCLDPHFLENSSVLRPITFGLICERLCSYQQGAVLGVVFGMMTNLSQAVDVCTNEPEVFGCLADVVIPIPIPDEVAVIAAVAAPMDPTRPVLFTVYWMSVKQISSEVRSKCTPTRPTVSVDWNMVHRYWCSFDSEERHHIVRQVVDGALHILGSTSTTNGMMKPSLCLWTILIAIAFAAKTKDIDSGNSSPLDHYSLLSPSLRKLISDGITSKLFKNRSLIRVLSTCTSSLSLLLKVASLLLPRRRQRRVGDNEADDSGGAHFVCSVLRLCLYDCDCDLDVDDSPSVAVSVCNLCIRLGQWVVVVASQLHHRTEGNVRLVSQWMALASHLFTFKTLSEKAVYVLHVLIVVAGTDNNNDNDTHIASFRWIYSRSSDYFRSHIMSSFDSSSDSMDMCCLSLLAACVLLLTNKGDDNENDNWFLSYEEFRRFSRGVLLRAQGLLVSSGSCHHRCDGVGGDENDKQSQSQSQQRLCTRSAAMYCALCLFVFPETRSQMWHDMVSFSVSISSFHSLQDESVPVSSQYPELYLYQQTLNIPLLLDGGDGSSSHMPISSNLATEADVRVYMTDVTTEEAVQRLMEEDQSLLPLPTEVLLRLISERTRLRWKT